MLTGMRAGSTAHLQLGEGVLLTGLNPDEAEDLSQLRQMIGRAIAAGEGVIGATRPDGTFRCRMLLRDLEAGSDRTASRGAMALDGWDIRLAGTMLEMTKENLELVLPGARAEREKGRWSITAGKQLRFTDRLLWVGETGEGLILLEMRDSLNLPGAALHFSGKDEGEMTFEFRAHAGAGRAPFRILLFDGEDAE